MNETTQLEMTELGDAKSLTQGWDEFFLPEDNPDHPTRPED